MCREFNPHSSAIFPLKILSAFMFAAYTQAHFRLDIFYEADNVSPDQTALPWEQSDFGSY